MGKNASKIIIKNLSSKYSQKILDHDKQSAIYSLKTSSKRVISKTVEASGNLVTILLIMLQKSQNLCNSIIYKQLQMNMIKKYLEKDIHFQKKDRKLLMI